MRECRCATSWCGLDLTFDLPVVTWNLKILDSNDTKLIIGWVIGWGV